MVTTSRTYYAPVFKVKVLDEVKALESVSLAARKNQLEPGLVYTWKSNESEIRKAARKEVAQSEREAAKAAKAGAKAGADILLSNGLKKRPVIVDENASFSSDGPKLTVHALGPWLADVVKRELPAAVNGQLEALIDRKLANLDERLAEAVRQALKKGIG